jgi:hypothetical protein
MPLACSRMGLRSSADEFVGLQVLEGPGAAHRQAGRGRRPGIGEVHDDEPVVLAEHQVVGLQLAPADSTALDTTMTRSLGCSMARAMVSPLRVKNTACFDIPASLHQRTLGSCVACSLKAMRPGLDRQASRADTGCQIGSTTYPAGSSHTCQKLRYT